MAVLAGKPLGYFIAPVLGWTGAGNVLRASSESGAFPGSVVPDGANRGLLLPLQSGTVDADAQDRRFRILDAGGAEGAGWIWRFETDANTDYRGVDDVRYFTGYHSPVPIASVPPGSDDCSLCYASGFRRILYLAVDSTVIPSEVYVYRKDLDDQGFEDWSTPTTFALEGPRTGGSAGREIAPDWCNTRMTELADGTILLVVRVQSARRFGASYDFDVYQSTDGGESFSLVATDVLFESQNLADFTIGVATDSQFSLARSGEVLRLTWAEASAGEVYSAISTDRGATWTGIPDASPPTLADNGDPSNPYVLDTCDLDGRGRFFMVGVVSGTQFTIYSSTVDGPFVAIGGGTFTQSIEPKMALCERALGWIWIFLEYSDGASTGNDFTTIYRSKEEDAASFALLGQWKLLNPGIQYDQSLYVPTRAAVTWAGDRFYFASGMKVHVSGAEINLPQAWTATLGWNKRTLGIVGYGANYSDDSDVGGTSVPLVVGTYLPLWQNQWNMRQGEPGIGAGSYTRTLAGTTSTGSNMNGFFIDTTGVGSARYYTYTDASGSEPWGGHATGLPRAFGFVCEVVTGVTLGTPQVGEYGFRVKAPSGPSSLNYRHVEIRIYGTTVEVYDLVGAVVRASLTVPTATTLGGSNRYRLWFNTGAGFAGQLAVIDAQDPDAEWIVSPVVTFSSSAVAPIQNEFEWGNLGNTQPGTIGIRWQEVSWNGRDTLRQATQNNYGFSGQTGLVNPDDLIGFAAREGYEIEVGDGLAIALAGAGGAEGDEFVGEIAHTFAAENILRDSPRIQWRTIAAPTNTLSAPNEFAGSEWTKNVSGATNTVADNTITAPDGTVTASRVTYTRATGGNVIFLRANGASQSPSATLAPASPRRGWTLTFWIKHANATAITFAMDVSDGIGSNAVSVPNDDTWRKVTMNVAYNGTGGAPGGWLDLVIGSYVGGALLTFDLWGVKLTADPEIVLAFSDEQTADERIPYDAIAVFGCNCRRLRVDTSSNPDFTSTVFASVLDLARFGSGSTAFATDGQFGRVVRFASSTATETVDREASGMWLYAEDGERQGGAARINRWRDLGTSKQAHLDGLSTDAATWIGATTPSSDFVVYGESGAADLTPSVAASFIRIRFAEQETPDGEDYFRLGTVILGVRKDLEVPLEWSYTDNKQPNVSSYRTRSAVAWSYREGPAQRTFTSRFVGDTTARFRDKIRFMLDELSFEVRPVALILDEDRPSETSVLGRIVSGSEEDNAAWFLDADGVKRRAGDLSITFVEDV